MEETKTLAAREKARQKCTRSSVIIFFGLGGPRSDGPCCGPQKRREDGVCSRNICPAGSPPVSNFRSADTYLHLPFANYEIGLLFGMVQYTPVPAS